jgi:peptidoglycan/xylan/chitin deacetylase (PgdA/CDA1 family)
MAAGTLVLLYHRVARLDRDPYALAVRPEHFAQHCDILRRRCDVVPLREMVGTSRQVAITFDDGYADNSQAASAILAATGLPATFFITAGRLGEHAEVWWDRLEQIVTRCNPVGGYIDVAIGDRRLWADLRSPMARARAHFALYWRLRPLAPHVIESMLADLESQLNIRAVDRATHRWMTVQELRSLAASHEVDIGAHTLTHPLLASLPPAQQQNEIHGSRLRLEAVLGKPVDLFSYPYGSRDAFDTVTTELVRGSGFARACTGMRGLADPNGNPFLIPRNVVGDWDAPTFERWLDRWFEDPPAVNAGQPN